MKNLILMFSLCFVLFSCFEKEEETTVVPQPPIEEGNVMECEQVINFIEQVNSCSIKYEGEMRASIRKFKFRNETVFFLNGTENYDCSKYPNTIVIDSRCNVICTFSLVPQENNCIDWNNSNTEFIETIWQDER